MRGRVRVDASILVRVAVEGFAGISRCCLAPLSSLKLTLQNFDSGGELKNASGAKLLIDKGSRSGLRTPKGLTGTRRKRS